MSSAHDKSQHCLLPSVIGIWGGGLVGLTTAAFFAQKGVKSIIVDIDEDLISRINSACFEPRFESWIGFNVKQHVTNGNIWATNNHSQLCRAAVKTHFVAVTTETCGDPDMSAIYAVLEKIQTMSPELCIIECTVVPGTVELLSRQYDIPLGIAGRRDLFLTGNNSLESCVRVFAGTSAEVSKRMHMVLSVVCKTLIQASSCKVVELTKVLDNAIFHTMAMFASQVASAYPSSDVTEAFALAATHWRLGNHTYFPSLGTGGHCVPLANKYLIQGAQRPEQLSIAAQSIHYNDINPAGVAGYVKGRLEPGGCVAVLGICFRGDIREHTESPHLKFARELVKLGVSVAVHDPYYSEDELKDICGGGSLRFPQDLRKFDFLGQSILDNQGIWEALSEDAKDLGISYRRVGRVDWLPAITDYEEQEKKEV
ncbi:nucleotide sugar dehydrogenase [Fusarium longipes]|uniref:Nucleotide sugar dehydrogenase n=1 Tax=Fusarium longipes TaxID=694270 RepID=A0A395SY15_9HYPO|nr:nucleotide sugar dehydrogenase [Fusarium longipes]